MKRFPELQARCGTYYDDDSTKTYGLLAEVDYRFFLAMQIDTVKLKRLDSLRLEIDTLFQDIDLIDTVETPISDTIVVDPVKDAAKYALLLEIAELDSIRTVLKDQIRTQQISDLDDVLDFNDTITVTEEWEVNQKAVNHFMIRVARGDTLESEDLDSLRIIAGTCIEDGGFATLAASTLLPVCEWADFEDVVCDRSRAGNRPVVGGHLSVIVFPNPTRDHLHFEFDRRFTGKLRLTDLFGRWVHQDFIADASNHNIILLNLRGIYIYQLISSDDRVVSSGKVSIVE